MQAVLEQILAENGSAYLIVDDTFRIRLARGRIDLLNETPPAAGESLFRLLPELVGSEIFLQEILAGQSPRLHLERINRDGLDGNLRYFDLLTLPATDAHGAIRGLIQVVTDVTDRGEIEQAYMQQRNELRLLKERVMQQNIELARTNAEIRDASRLKDEFLAGISHEVRTPLTAILGMSELLREMSSLDEEQMDLVLRIEESGRHLLTVINDLLDLAKIEAGQFELDRSPVSASHLCEASARMVNHLAIRKGLSFRIHVDPRVTMIRLDERRMRQALLNLLSNAIKFTPSGGNLGLDVEANPDGEAANFIVWDTGIGIAEEDIPRLFQPFSQIDGTYQRGQTGTGLGLVMVARLVELHGGSVKLTSELGAGSRFTISLPWSRADQQYDPAQELRNATEGNEEPVRETEPLPLSGHGEAVLLVEDDSIGAAVVTDYLQRCGYRITHALSGEEALACVRKEQPQLMIVDLRMRGMDGLETIRQMRARIATSTTPIIVLTALAMPGTQEKSIEAGANVFLSKPVQLRRLTKIAAALIAGQVPPA